MLYEVITRGHRRDRRPGRPDSSVRRRARPGRVRQHRQRPELDGDELRATVEFPNGTPFEVTQDAIKRIEQGIFAIADRLETRRNNFV